MIPGFGGTEVLILLVVVLLLFGAKRIPGLARSLGGGVREFRKGISGEDEGPVGARDREEDEEMPEWEACGEAAVKDGEGRVKRVEQGL